MQSVQNECSGKTAISLHVKRLPSLGRFFFPPFLVASPSPPSKVHLSPSLPPPSRPLSQNYESLPSSLPPLLLFFPSPPPLSISLPISHFSRMVYHTYCWTIANRCSSASQKSTTGIGICIGVTDTTAAPAAEAAVRKNDAFSPDNTSVALQWRACKKQKKRKKRGRFRAQTQSFRLAVLLNYEARYISNYNCTFNKQVLRSSPMFFHLQLCFH